MKKKFSNPQINRYENFKKNIESVKDVTQVVDLFATEFKHYVECMEKYYDGDNRNTQILNAKDLQEYYYLMELTKVAIQRIHEIVQTKDFDPSQRAVSTKRLTRPEVAARLNSIESIIDLISNKVKLDVEHVFQNSPGEVASWKEVEKEINQLNGLREHIKILTASLDASRQTPSPSRLRGGYGRLPSS